VGLPLEGRLVSRSPQIHAVLYSGGQERRNASIHERLLELACDRPERVRRRASPVHMLYLPYTREGSATYFARFRRRYRAFGAGGFACLAPDDPALIGSAQSPPDPRARGRYLRLIEESDVVYLAGGNTFEFLRNLRRARLLAPLRRFASRGGVLAGLSAGALLLTPDIGLAAWPDFDRDENDVALASRHWGALGVVDFEFFPHYRDSARYRAALARHSRRTRRAVYACRDGSGVVISGQQQSLYGEVWLFDRGRVRKLTT
jgi:dipeptidase E